jgi:hypothetical protein
VNIIFGFHRQIEIDDVRNRWHVDATRSHIRRNHNLTSPFEQHPNDSVASMLRQIAMQGGDRVSCIAEASSLVFGRQFGRHKNDRLIHPRRRKYGI